MHRMRKERSENEAEKEIISYTEKDDRNGKIWDCKTFLWTPFPMKICHYVLAVIFVVLQ